MQSIEDNQNHRWKFAYKKTQKLIFNESRMILNKF